MLNARQALEKADQARTSATAASSKVTAALNTVEEILVQLCKYSFELSPL